VKLSDESDRSVRVITLLREVAAAEHPLTANEISERTELPKATVYRLCDQLLAAGLIRRQIGGRGFISGPQLIDLAQEVIAGKATYLARHAVLQRVARETGETCNLVVPDRTAMVYWDRVETEWPLRLQLPIGTRVPFHATASGKMYLAMMSAATRARLLHEIDLAAYTERTVTARSDLDHHLNDIAAQRYSLDDEEFITGMTAVAVPVFSASGGCVASLAVHAPKSRMTVEHARAHVPLLIDAASRLSEGIPEHPRAKHRV